MSGYLSAILANEQVELTIRNIMCIPETRRLIKQFRCFSEIVRLRAGNMDPSFNIQGPASCRSKARTSDTPVLLIRHSRARGNPAPAVTPVPTIW